MILKKLFLTGIAVLFLATGAAHAAERNMAAKNAFEHDNPCPSTGQSGGACPGYVVDHVIPLRGGGADHQSNMQWQTGADAKAKDKIECDGHKCGR